MQFSPVSCNLLPCRPVRYPQRSVLLASIDGVNPSFVEGNLYVPSQYEHLEVRVQGSAVTFLQRTQHESEATLTALHTYSAY